VQRRSLLKAAAALPLAALAPALGARVVPPVSRVRPQDPQWPDAASWQQLNAEVGGSLSAVQPLFAACAQDAAEGACRATLASISNPFYLGDEAAGTQVSGYFEAWRCAPSAYVVRARGTADVVAAVNFARRRNLRLVVKGGGHSYLGTSSAADSLLIWTRGMNDIALESAFVPAGCAGQVAPSTAVTVGAGAMWIDVYHAVTSRAGRYVQGGGCTTVGVAGLIQSGGFGSFSKRYGSAAASLLEAEVVTADGSLRTVNACRDPELFWALKGGGGGSFGVVTRLTLRTHELPEYFGAAWGSIHADSDASYIALIERFLGFYAERLANPHWGEQFAVRPDNVLRLSLVSAGLNREESRALWEPFFSWVRSRSEYQESDALGAGAKLARTWWDIEGNHNMVPDPRAGAPAGHGFWEGDQDQVGAFLYGYESLWLPAALLAGESRAQLARALFAASRHKEVGLHCNKGLAFAPAAAISAALDTAMNPQVTRAFALAIIADGAGPAYPGQPRAVVDEAAARADAQAIARATAELRKVAPGAGAYLSESSYFGADWRQQYWGAHYARLAAVKKRYDPEGLFFVHHGVGSEAWSADGFTRVG